MVTHHTASPITANARGRSNVLALGSRSVASLIAELDHCSALPPAFRSPICSRFHTTRQRAEQNRACSRRGTNEVPHRSEFRISAITLVPHIVRSGPGPACHERPPAVQAGQAPWPQGTASVDGAWRHSRLLVAVVRVAAWSYFATLTSAATRLGVVGLATTHLPYRRRAHATRSPGRPTDAQAPGGRVATPGGRGACRLARAAGRRGRTAGRRGRTLGGRGAAGVLPLVATGAVVATACGCPGRCALGWRSPTHSAGPTHSDAKSMASAAAVITAAEPPKNTSSTSSRPAV